MKQELVVDFLEQRAEHHPHKVAMVHHGHQFTYDSLNTEANRIAGWLRQTGLQPGDRIVSCAENSARLIIALFGALKAGTIFVPIHPETSSQKLQYVVQDCSPKIVITDPEQVNVLEVLQRGFSGMVLLTSSGSATGNVPSANLLTWDAVTSPPDQSPNLRVAPDDLAIIIYTSGSTKDPKGVMEPHRQVVFATTAINSVIGNCSDDVILCGLPLSFDYGLYQVFLAFQVGATLVLERDFAFPLSIPQLLKEHRVTGFPGVPALFAMLLRSRLLERVELPNLRYLSSTGDILPAAHIRQLQRFLPNTTIFPMYGLTECKRVSIVPKGCLAGRESSVGLPLPGTSVLVVDENGHPCPPDVMGELTVRGPHVMAGYWNDPQETARRFRRDAQTGELMLLTGDLFRMAEDGFLYFEGRTETFIKSRGQKVSPAEVESALCEIPGVVEAAAVGVPDLVLGEVVCAFVSVSKPGVIVEPDIVEHCRRTLPPAARPGHIVILESPLPKTINGKIDRPKLRVIAKIQSRKVAHE